MKAGQIYFGVDRMGLWRKLCGCGAARKALGRRARQRSRHEPGQAQM